MPVVFQRPRQQVNGNGEINTAVLANEVAIPNNSIGWIKIELDPDQFGPSDSFMVAIETKIDNGPWEFRAGNNEFIFGNSNGSYSEPFSWEWGYNTSDPAFTGRVINVRFKWIINGTFRTPILIERS